MLYIVVFLIKRLLYATISLGNYRMKGLALMREYSKYSVLMSVYRKENSRYFRESIESVLNQTVVTDDFVIVCDGPLTDELNSVISEYEKSNSIFNIVRLKENKGLGKALNEGLKHCRHELVGRMDSDDICIADRFERQLEIFSLMNVDIVGGAVTEFSDSIDNPISNRVLPHKHDDIVAFSKKRNPFNHPSVMFRKSVVLAAGGYKDFPYFEDYYLWVRMLSKGAIGYNIEEPILYMRAGSDMYQRRGGRRYVKHMLRYKKEIYNMGYTTRWQYLQSTVPHVVVGMMPNKLRQIFYKKVLRK